MTGTRPVPGSWLTTFPGRYTAHRWHLVCLPQAGAGAGQFRTLQDRLGADFEVLAVQLPGREQRWHEEPLSSVEEVVNGLVPALLPRLVRPFIVYGHSMGALLGYELTRVLGHGHGRWPEALILAACRPPDLVSPEEARSSTSEEALRAALAAEATAAGVDFDEELAELLMPPMRADAGLCVGYRHNPGPQLTCPVVAWAGKDDPMVTADHVAGWRAYTTGRFQVECFPGGHSFHRDVPHLIADGVRRAVAAPGDSHA